MTQMAVKVELRKNPETAVPEEEYTLVYPFNTTAEIGKSIGCYTGIRDFVQKLPFTYRGAHYGVTVEFMVS
jgi:hypothetical protein